MISKAAIKTSRKFFYSRKKKDVKWFCRGDLNLNLNSPHSSYSFSIILAGKCNVVLNIAEINIFKLSLKQLCRRFARLRIHPFLLTNDANKIFSKMRQHLIKTIILQSISHQVWWWRHIWSYSCWELLISADFSFISGHLFWIFTLELKDCQWRLSRTFSRFK